MKTIFKKGDRVFDIRFGWGEVFEVDETKKEGVWVEFNENDCRKYSNLGLYTEFDVVPMLSFTEYNLNGFSQDRPKKEPQIGSLCFFSDDLQSFETKTGQVGYLDRIENNEDYRYLCRGETGLWRYCKQIEINEI